MSPNTSKRPLDQSIQRPKLQFIVKTYFHIDNKVVLTKEGSTFIQIRIYMIHRLNGTGGRSAMFDFILIVIIAAFMILASVVLLLSATILVPSAIFQSKVLPLGLFR